MDKDTAFSLDSHCLNVSDGLEVSRQKFLCKSNLKMNLLLLNRTA